ncbi:energy transducer TonB [Pseudomonas sp. MAP12]|uniref:Energy transducer TonB n=1 Tax=Geopseudomonas aromaticivorans TaxID=2849492 RepID=A0ABS6MX33_9GAMM|nr:energy transducer TonB [Pseudomonas aromaticivorans]MBV2133368.1 energy transducer TonB [Pseudomonas aromaticivorans]
MIDEQQRRAYLGAMQVTTWLPRTVLPFAAPSRPELLTLPAVAAEPPRSRPQPIARQAQAAQLGPEASVVDKPAAPRKIAVLPLKSASGKAAAPQVEASAAVAVVRREPPPRFALQLLRAGNCLLLVELPSGELFASRDPAYRLLKDLLRAAGLPDSPRAVGEPIRWPLIRGNREFDQGPAAARDYVRAVVQGQLEQEPAVCVWLVGTPAARFAGEEDEVAACREVALGGLGSAWTLPGLDQLMEAPPLKAELWHSMRRAMRRWTSEQ